MKVTGIAGSLRVRSNTLLDVKAALKVLEEEGIQTVTNFAHNMAGLMKKLFI